MTAVPIRAILPAALLILAACNGAADAPQPTAAETAPDRIAATGKQAQELASVPAEVLAAAMAARPNLQVAAVEHEQRDGNDYYDVAGLLDGAEVELDITRIDGRWTVVEVQRDIAASDVPPPVADALAQAHPGFDPRRVIESDQGDGIVIYEFFGPGKDGQDSKVEVKTEGGKAEVLTSEWIH